MIHSDSDIYYIHLRPTQSSKGNADETPIFWNSSLFGVLAALVKQKSRMTFARHSLISTYANLIPIQFRGPSPKLKYGSFLALSMSRNLDGSNFSGSGYYSGL